MTAKIIIATPHERYGALIERIRNRAEIKLMAVTSAESLDAGRVAAFAPDYIFFPHWSWKIPANIYENFECVIFHMTNVPFGRGGSPLQNLVRRGYEETRLTALKCVEAMDAGPVYLKRPLSLLGTAEEIFLRAATLMEEMIVEIIDVRPTPVEQVGDVVSFKRLKPVDGDLRQAKSIREVYDMVRMLDATGYPSAYLIVDDYRLEFSRASLKPDEVIADVRISRHVEE